MLKNYYQQIIKQDLINKFDTKEDLPKLQKIILNFGCRNFSIQHFATTVLALELITGKKSTITVSKKPNIVLKIQKGQPAGCKIELKNNDLYSFLEKLTTEILPRLKNFSDLKFKNQRGNILYKIPENNLQLKELDNQYPLFANLPTLDINICLTSKNHKKTLFLSKSIKLLIQK